MNFSIIMPVSQKTDLVEIALYNLRTYSYNHAHEILLMGNNESSHFLEWLKKKKYWLKKHNITYHHCDIDMNAIAKHEEPDRSGEPIAGSLIATAMNMGIEAAKNDWIVGISDDDLFYSKNWDKPILDIIDNYDPTNSVLRPVHVQPRFQLEGEEVTVSRFWESASWRDICQHYYAIPTTVEINNTWGITENDWNKLVEIVSRDNDIRNQKCGIQERIHWIPLIIHKDLIEKVGGWDTTYEHAYSFDIYFDDVLGKHNVTKYQPSNSFVLHKGLLLKEWLTKEGLDFINSDKPSTKKDN